MENLLTNATGNGAGTSLRLTSGLPNQEVMRTVYALGTFDGASIALESSPNGTTWAPLPIEDGAFTEPGVWNVTLHAPVWLRAVVSDAGASTSVTVTAV